VRATIQELAELVHGQVQGDGMAVVTDARSLRQAGPEDITFIENEKRLAGLRDCRAAAVVVPSDLPVRDSDLPRREGSPSGSNAAPALLRVTDPLVAFLAIVQHLRPRVEPLPPGIDPRAVVHPTVRLGADCVVQPLAVIGAGSTLGARCRIHSGAVIGRDCHLGDDVVLYPNAVLYDGTLLGDRVIVHAGAVLGADGYGYRFQLGRHVKVPQLGWVEVGDDAEIGAGTTIDRGTIDATRIGPGTKIDNQVQIGHNCQIGAHNLLVSQVGIAGSTTTGQYVVIAGQVGIADHVEIGDQVLIGAKAGIFRDIPSGERMLGCPATPENRQKRLVLSIERLPGVIQDVRRIKEHLGLTDEELGRQAG
jgi:UDP-3-O-[3-hydroxymyristoyl] glucosamine N-acyltransferase